MLRDVKIAGGVERHEEVFLARYTRLRAWALQLTGGEREPAEDLVQDAYIHFTFARPELEAIGNLDGYLYSMLRNLHRSQTRRAQRLQSRALPVLEYDSAEMTLRGTGDADRLRVQDELRQVCRYACARKETSKAGSVLILRFIHGYYPREIALLMRATRAAVEERLRVAREEAARYLRNPESLRFLRGATADADASAAGTALARPTDEFLNELRRTVFQSRRGECPTEESLALVYREAEEETRREREESRREEGTTQRRDSAPTAPDAAALAHLVSCPRCIDAVNKLLALPPLSERYPTDSLGNDTKNTRGGDGGDGDGDGDGPSGTDSEAPLLRRLRRRATDVFEHRPQQLCVSVNGRLLAAQTVGAPHSEQTLHIGGTGEEVEFVEVFSEQEVRLLFLPVGGAHALARVSLSDERTLEATLQYDEHEPTLRIVYQQPLAAARAHEAAASHAATHDAYEASAAQPPASLASGARPDDETKQERETTPPRRTFARRMLAALARLFGVLKNFVGGLKGSFNIVGRLFSPRALAAGLAVLLVAALLFVRLQVTSVSAAELLRRSAAAEETSAADSSLALRRTFYVEELRTGPGARFTRRRVEVWQSAARGLKLRRVYDEQDKLVAGEWARADGTSTVYRAGLPPQHTSAVQTGDAARDARTLDTLLEAGDLWRLEPSARTFSALVGGAERLKVEEAVGSYVINYAGETATSNDADRADETAARGDADGAAARVVSLVRASLRLNGADLRATEQTLAVRHGGAVREYRFTEGGFERRRAEEVAPEVFEPDASLFGEGGAARASSTAAANRPSEAREVEPPASSAAPAAASPELEIEVTYLLNQIKANLGEQVGMTRTARGALRVEALVETERRKEEILRALAPVAANPSVVVEVSTVEEALRRRPQTPPAGATRDGGVREVEVASNRIPADAELRRHFSARLVGDARVEEEMKRFAERAMGRSRQALLHASALRRLAARFTPEELRALAPEARERWRSMIREHAGEYRREVERLRAELRPVFGGVAASGEAAGGGVAGVLAERLLRLSYSNDEAVRSAFAVSEDGGSADAVKSAQFWRSLATAERLAAAIEEMYRDQIRDEE